MSHVLNYHNHFPFRAGASLLEGKVKEFDDDPRHSDITDLSTELLASPNIQVSKYSIDSINFNG